MRIPNLTMSDALVARLNNLNVNQSKYNDQLSNGQRITLASQDAPAASRVLRLQSEKSAISVFNTNGDRALSISQASYSALARLKELSDRATELATLAGSDTVSAAERQAYSVEVAELVKAARDAANTTYQGEYLFNGTDTAAGTPPYDLAGTITPGDGPLIQLSEKVSLSPFNTGAANAQVGAFIGNLSALYSALQSDSTSAISTAKSSLLGSENHLVAMLADNAAIQSRIESLRIQNAERVHNMDSLVSREVDVDTAQTMVNLTRARVSYQAAMEAGAQVLKLSLLDYIR